MMYGVLQTRKVVYAPEKRRKLYIKEKKNRLGAVAVVLGMLLLVLTVGIQEKEIRNSALKAMVFIEDNGYGGNGSVYKIKEDELVIVTTYHLLQNGEDVTVRFPDNRAVEGKVFGVNKKHDVGFVTVRTEDIPYETLENVRTVQTKYMTYDSLEQGDYMEYCFLSYDGVFVCQETYEGSIGHMNWYVPDFDDHLIYNYCKVRPGMSGCAAVAADGSYLGMVIGGYDNESAALSVHVIDKVYQELE